MFSRGRQGWRPGWAGEPREVVDALLEFSSFRPQTEKSGRHAMRSPSFAGRIGDPFSHLSAHVAIQSRMRRILRRIFL